MKDLIKLHLGCGKRYIPGFIHVDILDYKHIDHIRNIDDLSIFKDNSVDLIYNCHVLEHFKRKEIQNVLNEWYRVLKPNGILRTSVPGFEEMLKIYDKYNDLNLILGGLVGGQTYNYNFHNMVFDFKTLKDYLNKSKFKKIYKYNWRNTEHSNIDDYSQAYIPHMDKDKGLPLSLNVEAIK